MKLNNLNILLPFLFGLLVIIITKNIPINIYEYNWNDTFIDYINLSKIKLDYIGINIDTFFIETNNDIKTIDNYILKNVYNQLNVSKNNDTYYRVSSNDNEIYLNDNNNYSLTSSIKSFIINNSGIYDNQKHIIVEENDIYRYYLYISFNNYTSYNYSCYYIDQPNIIYDFRCLFWYVISKNDNNIHYVIPYREISFENVMIVSYKKVIYESILLGIIDMDYISREIDNIIYDNYDDYDIGYTFLINDIGLIISYPNFNHIMPTQTIFTIESDISSQIWNNIINKKNTNTLHIDVQKNGNTWFIIYKYLPNINYFLITMYPSFDISYTTSSTTSNILNNTNLFKIIILCNIILILLLITLVIILYNKKYNKQIVKLSDNTYVDIELGIKKHIDAKSEIHEQYTNINDNYEEYWCD